jgi:hypothetical protein
MFKIKPKNIRDIKSAITMQKILDHWYDDGKEMRDELHRAITDSILHGNPKSPRVFWTDTTK